MYGFNFSIEQYELIFSKVLQFDKDNSFIKSNYLDRLSSYKL